MCTGVIGNKNIVYRISAYESSRSEVKECVRIIVKNLRLKLRL